MNDLPPGSDVVECDAIGRIVVNRGVGLSVPEPGIAVEGEATTVAGVPPRSFYVEVDADGTISYQVPENEASDSAAGAAQRRRATSACSDNTYIAADRKEYDTWQWWVGDGALPGALSQSEAKDQFATAVDHISHYYNDCGFGEPRGFPASYGGTTTYEANMTASGDCQSRDHKSTFDGGELPTGTVAMTCSWTTPNPGVKNDLIEADVRFNTTRYDFTPTGGADACRNKYDILSVATHEVGHVAGLKDLNDSAHAYLTMYGSSFLCSTIARTLGMGDWHGLETIYAS